MQCSFTFQQDLKLCSYLPYNIVNENVLHYEYQFKNLSPHLQYLNILIQTVTFLELETFEPLYLAFEFPTLSMYTYRLT